MKDDTELIQGYLDRGEPIPKGHYTIRGPVRLPKDYRVPMENPPTEQPPGS